MTSPEQVRSRYSTKGRYEFAGAPVQAEQCSVRSFNFGQHWRTEGIVSIPYRVLLPYEFFLDMLRAQLPDLQADMQQDPDPADEWEQALRQRDWPSAEEICQDPKLAAWALDWYAHDMLLAWFGDLQPKTSLGFVLNTIDTLGFEQQHPLITGSGRRTGMPVRYQDQ